jgi:hypothetical protein
MRAEFTGFSRNVTAGWRGFLYAYTLDTNPDEPHDVQARMFTPA